MTQQLDRQAGVSRRGLLGGIALGAGGLLVGAAAGHAAATQDAPEDSEPAPGSVPEPWAMRTRVAMRNGTRNAGSGVEAMASARASPTPELRSTWPSAPPAPVMSRIRPAEAAASANQPCALFRGVHRGRST